MHYFINKIIFKMPVNKLIKLQNFRWIGKSSSLKIQLFVSVILITCIQISLAQPANFRDIVFGCHTDDINDFEQFVITAKAAGATHIQINAEDLPLTYWQMDPPGDPYPAWVISNPGLLKTFIPGVLKNYIPNKTAENVCNILEERCQILRKYQLKAVFHTFEPQMLPEAVYEKYPDWRGPRVDHPMRSRTPRFAPAIENPQVLELYTQSIEIFLNRCPEVEILYFRTNDSGAGVDWSIGLYDGRNGNTNYEDISMAERIRGFISALQRGAENVGVNLAVNIYDTDELDSKTIATELKKNMAIDGYEGPAASPFKADVDNLLYFQRAFTPIVGIPRPLDFIENLQKASHSSAPRLFVAIADKPNCDLYLKIYNQFWKSPTRGIIENLQLLRNTAAQEIGEENADKLFELWVALNEAIKVLELSHAGGTIFNLGCVHQRWLVRPFVPFPAELQAEEKEYYRKHQFQARSESAADYLLDLQAMRLYTGEGGYRYIHKVMNKAKEYINKAKSLSQDLEKTKNEEQKKKFELLTIRLTLFDYLMNNVLNVVTYQSQLDQLDISGSPSTVVAMGSGSSVSRQKMLETVRREIDNTINIIELLRSQEKISTVFDHALSKDEEYIRLIGPDLIEQLQKKIKIMNAHWKDYNRIFSRPNL
jgi:hypothetical protein